MKNKIGLVILVICSAFLGMKVVFAAPSVSTSVSQGTIEKGSNVTFYVTIRNVASWNIKMNGIGATTGCSSSQADATGNGNNTTKTFSITCKGSDIGLISFSVSGDATSQDGSNVNVSGSKRVNVTAVKPKSTNNYLKSITVGEYALTPAFAKETLEYTVTVPSTVNSINLGATPEDGTASIDGTGEKEVEEGANPFEIRVNAQNGDERIYKVTVMVEDQNPIEVMIDDEKYTVIKNIKNVEKPDLYESSTITIQGMEVPTFVSDVTEYTLVALKNVNGKVVFAIYDEKNSSYQLYEEQKSNPLVLYLLPFDKEFAGYIKSSVIIKEREYEAYKVSEDSDYAIIYAMNVETGEKNYYLYHAGDNTYQLYFDEMVEKLSTEKSTYQQVILGLAGGCVLLAILCMIGFLRKPNKKLLRRIEQMEEQRKSEMVIDKEPIIDESTKLENKELEKTPKEKKKKREKKSKKETKNASSKKVDEVVEKSNNDTEDTEVLEVDEALHKMNDAEKIIEEFEKTMALSKEELKKAKNEERSVQEIEETMYDLFEEDHKRKKRK
ncbi:MAG: cadherin-like beta sandwich domain-containing protein [Bacilli bacterium]|nr:cadherin-like beta sandwich domain-containing protein [Bacilli bacterium]